MFTNKDQIKFLEEDIAISKEAISTCKEIKRTSRNNISQRQLANKIISVETKLIKQFKKEIKKLKGE